MNPIPQPQRQTGTITDVRVTLGATRYGDQAKQFNPNRQPTIAEFVCIGIMALAILGTVALFLYGAVRWASAGDYLAAGVTGAAGLAILPLAWLEFRDQHRRNEMERDRHAERLP